MSLACGSRAHRRRSAAFLLLAAVAGCAVGPDFNRPSPPEVSGYTPEPLAAETASAEVAGGATQRFVQGMDMPGQWWRLFHSQALDTLIEQALKSNADLQAAQAALRVAMETVYAKKAFYSPRVAGSFQPSRNKTATGALSLASAS